MIGGQVTKLPMQTVPPADEFLDLEDIPFFVDPIVAWRAWGVCGVGACDCSHRRGILLRSITHRVPWLRRKPTRAHCLNCWKKNPGSSVRTASLHHSAPDMAHGCGIYSVKTIDDAMAWSNHGTKMFRVVGEVLLWGKVFRYTHGYIAEYAYPKSLWIPDDWSRFAEPAHPAFQPEEIALMLEDTYGIEATVGDPG